MNTSPNTPPEILEMKAAEQRRRLHNSVIEIKSQVRETLDIKKNAREYIVPASAAAAVLGLFLGYAAGGMVTG